MRFVFALAAIFLLVSESSADTRYLDKVRDSRLQRIEDLDRAGNEGGFDRAEDLVALGRIPQAIALVADERLGDEDPARAALLWADIHLTMYDFEDAEREIRMAEAGGADRDAVARLRIRLWNAQEDLPRIDSMATRLLTEDEDSPAGLIGRGSVAYQTLRYDDAKADYDRLLAIAGEAEDRARALLGLANISYRENDFEAAADLLTHALGEAPPTPGLLYAATLVLIRLGEVSEAIALAKEALRLDPYHEASHYLLGNGYTDLNYTELEEAYPGAFQDAEGNAYLTEARNLMAQGERDQADAMLRNVRRAFPDLVDSDLLLGVIAWERGQADSAIARFQQALHICPDYGRAHNAFAKAMEWKKLRVNVNRDMYQRDLDMSVMPVIPGIEQFVLNWEALSERHQKRVALSMTQWARFIPVLNEAGATYYIKPLHERLSESPFLDELADLRISYDSRLWDDVRGCGGFNTVTGVEDVERTVYQKYNTVLHELSHQVHYVLTPDEKRRIQEEYARAKEQEKAGQKTFVSRYQGSSVWEYFAEGINSYFSPKRDEYDTREIVRERLEEFDPELLALLEEVLTDTSVAKYFAPALVVAASDKLENGKPEEALALLEKAIARSPEDEGAWTGVAYARSVLGENQAAVQAAQFAVDKHPAVSGPWIRLAQAVFHRTGDRKAPISVLEEGAAAVGESDRYDIDHALGNAYLRDGQLKPAAAAYERVLAYQSDHPGALWGIGLTFGFNGRKEEAEGYFQQAIKRRNGIPELRSDYARYLIREGRLEDA
ncbi:MAG: tetratricopeptide repeat protein, partial [Gemmatimonadetes bacterium]|nr:tetratricopeptide repeat protein [Gemmatimonadota bacterium]